MFTWERFKEEIARANPLAWLYIKSAEAGYEAGTVAVPFIKAVKKGAEVMDIDDPQDFLNLLWYGIIGLFILWLIYPYLLPLLVVKYGARR